MVLEIIMTAVLAFLALCICIGIRAVKQSPQNVDIEEILETVWQRIKDGTISVANVEINEHGVHILATAAEHEENGKEVEGNE